MDNDSDVNTATIKYTDLVLITMFKSRRKNLTITEKDYLTQFFEMHNYNELIEKDVSFGNFAKRLKRMMGVPLQRCNETLRGFLKLIYENGSYLVNIEIGANDSYIKIEIEDS